MVSGAWSSETIEMPSMQFVTWTVVPSKIVESESSRLFRGLRRFYDFSRRIEVLFTFSTLNNRRSIYDDRQFHLLVKLLQCTDHGRLWYRGASFSSHLQRKSVVRHHREAPLGLVRWRHSTDSGCRRGTPRQGVLRH